jgi:hypothetical protein
MLDRSAWGWYDIEAQKIVVSAGLSPEMLRSTLAHEAMHAAIHLLTSVRSHEELMCHLVGVLYSQNWRALDQITKKARR